MDKFCFGVDVGGTAIKVGLFNFEGSLVKQWSFPTKRSKSGKDILGDVTSFIDKTLSELGYGKEQILGVGVGVPGPVRSDGEVLELPNLGLGHFNIEEELSHMLGLPVKAGNDANLAALGEYWNGSGKGFESMVFITLGTGVGGGVVMNGQMITGSTGAAGEIGHLPVNHTEENPCGCGKKGCLEQYASATGIVRLAIKTLARSKEPSLLRELGEISAKNVFDIAKREDNLALSIVTEACSYLGLACGQIAQVLDPEVFVIGGGVSKAGEIIVNTVKSQYEINVMDALKKKEFKIATLGNDAGIYGASRLILRS